MLNDTEIKDLCITRHMITPFDESQLQPCSYDVTLSKSIVRYFGRGEINAMDYTLHDLEYIRFAMNDDGFVLDPNEFILGSTNEGVTSRRTSPRASKVSRRLAVSVLQPMSPPDSSIRGLPVTSRLRLKTSTIIRSAYFQE